MIIPNRGALYNLQQTLKRGQVNFPLASDFKSLYRQTDLDYTRSIDVFIGMQQAIEQNEYVDKYYTRSILQYFAYHYPVEDHKFIFSPQQLATAKKHRKEYERSSSIPTVKFDDFSYALFEPHVLKKSPLSTADAISVLTVIGDTATKEQRQLPIYQKYIDLVVNNTKHTKTFLEHLVAVYHYVPTTILKLLSITDVALVESSAPYLYARTDHLAAYIERNHLLTPIQTSEITETNSGKIIIGAEQKPLTSSNKIRIYYALKIAFVDILDKHSQHKTLKHALKYIKSELKRSAAAKPEIHDQIKTEIKSAIKLLQRSVR